MTEWKNVDASLRMYVLDTLRADAHDAAGCSCPKVADCRAKSAAFRAALQQLCDHPSVMDSMPAHCGICGEEMP